MHSRPLTTTLALVSLVSLIFTGSLRAQAPRPQVQRSEAAPPERELGEAQDAAGKLVLERLAQSDAKLHTLIRRCRPRQIVLVSGRYDHTDRVLRSLGLPFETSPPGEFFSRDLSAVRLLILDCPGVTGHHSASRLRRFVARGGTVLSTDWTMLHSLEEAFPGTIRYSRRPTGDDVVRISEVDRHFLARGVFPPGRHAAWWLEDRSHPVDVLDRSRVRTLFRSREMERRYGSGAIGLTFTEGRGRVVHLVSHTYLQRNVLRHPWERRSFAEEAKALGFRTDGAAYRELDRRGVLKRIPAGHLNAACSIQQFVLNVVVSALGPVPIVPQPPIVRPPRPPRPPVPQPGPPRPAFARLTAARETLLHSAPRGEGRLRIIAGLRLRVLRHEGDWVEVETPGGQRGWVPRNDTR